LAGGCNQTVIWHLDRPRATPGSEPSIGVHWVTADWFKTLRVSLIAGRGFTNADRLGGPKVVLVGATAARKIWPNASPIGARIGVGQGGFDTATVVGVVGDVRFETIDSLPARDVYLPYSQSPRSGAIVYIRTSVEPGSITAAARRRIHDVGADLPVYDVRTLSSRVADASAQARFSALLLAVFAAAALLLASLGIYGVMAFAVAQRTREIGIRVALGADRVAVLRLIVGQGAGLAVAGLAIGLVCALAATRVLHSLLFGVTPSDPLSFGAVVAILAVAALLAAWVPARQASKLPPAVALRD
jgi:putative ABC transport system permease protein